MDILMNACSDMMPDGSYGVSIEIGADNAFALDHGQALAYAATCHAVAATADHCVACLRLLTEQRGIAPAAADQFISRHGARTAPITDQATAPIRYLAGYRARTWPEPGAGQIIPAICVRLGTRDLGWISPDELRTHASAVLTLLAWTDLNTALRESLITDIGVTDTMAHDMISELAEFVPRSP